jgi:hypothetical protein
LNTTPGVAHSNEEKERKRKKKTKAKITVGPPANCNHSLNSKEAKMPTQYEYNLKRTVVKSKIFKVPFYLLAADSIVIFMYSFLLCLLLSFSHEIQV